MYVIADLALYVLCTSNLISSLLYSTCLYVIYAVLCFCYYFIWGGVCVDDIYTLTYLQGVDTSYLP
jgi:hypothetical protein